nr:unnamed protein product [Callosobruchus chinensis]
MKEREFERVMRGTHAEEHITVFFIIAIYLAVTSNSNLLANVIMSLIFKSIYYMKVVSCGVVGKYLLWWSAPEVEGDECDLHALAGPREEVKLFSFSEAMSKHRDQIIHTLLVSSICIHNSTLLVIADYWEVSSHTSMHNE